MKIFSDEEYYPNLYVFRETLKALKRISNLESRKMKVLCIPEKLLKN